MEAIPVTATVRFPRLLPHWRNAVFLGVYRAVVSSLCGKQRLHQGMNGGWEDSGSTLGNTLSCFWFLRATGLITESVRRV